MTAWLDYKIIIVALTQMYKYKISTLQLRSNPQHRSRDNYIVDYIYIINSLQVKCLTPITIYDLFHQKPMHDNDKPSYSYKPRYRLCFRCFPCRWYTDKTHCTLISFWQRTIKLKSSCRSDWELYIEILIYCTCLT